MSEESIDVLEEGDEAPPFDLPAAGGGRFALEDLADRQALLVVFTCNHCPYAQAKEEALNAIAADYDEVAVVGINPNDAEQYPEDSFDAMQTAVESGRLRLDAYLRDESQAVAAAYGAVCTPDPFLFRRADGRFRLAYHGRLDDALNPDSSPSGEPGFEVRRAIDEVLAGEAVSVPWHASRGCSIKWKPGNEPDYWDDL